MPSIVIRDVPEDVHRTLASRAAAEGQSLQQYMLAMATQSAGRRTQREVLDEIRRRARTFPPISTEDILADLRAGRDRLD
ncbi:MAG: antitoxin [Actinomycetia bacterium]|nr:antitoxin [Actinomycetes bacterium]